MSGGPVGGANNSYVAIVGNEDRLTVKNGTIGGFRIGGIRAVSRHYLIVENMRIINSFYGINNENGAYARLQNNTISTNTTYGILCGDSCHVEGNVVSDNGGLGIRVTRGTVLGNTVYSNGSYGIISVFLMGLGNNTIFDNNLDGGGGQTDGGQIALHPNACTPPPGSC
jgi:parallel beta-helix repeat protein